MLKIENQRHYDEVVAFAKKHNLYEGTDDNTSLKSRLDYLEQYGCRGDKDGTRVRLFRDFAPYSFGFVIEVKNADGGWECLFHGGLVFHGHHDGHGNGSAPTFAVTLEPTAGWSIHT